MKNHSPEDLISIATAYILANGHAEGALLQFNELQRFAAEMKKADRARNAYKWMERVIPAAVSLALALELKLKVLYFQRHGVYPKTHDLLEVVNQIPEHSRNTVAETYEYMYARDVPLEIVEFNFTWSETSRKAHAASKSELAKFHPALQHVSGAYIRWRYLYEKMRAPEDTHINFRVLLCLIEAVNDAIAKYPGNLQAKFDIE